MDQALTISTYVGEKMTTVFVAGEVDQRTAPVLRQEVKRLVDIGSQGICVDASSVDFVDSSGIGVLLGAHKLTSAAGIPFHLRPSTRMQALLRRTGLLQHFGLAPV